MAFNLTPNQLALLSTGLGIMQNSRGRSLGEAVGAGGQQGIQALQSAQRQQQMLAQAQQNQQFRNQQQSLYEQKFAQDTAAQERLNLARQKLKTIDPSDKRQLFDVMSDIDPVAAFNLYKPTPKQVISTDNGFMGVDLRDLSTMPIVGQTGEPVMNPAYNPNLVRGITKAKEEEKIVKTKDEENRDIFLRQGDASGTGVTAEQIEAVMPGLLMTESAGDINAVSKAGARGAYQTMPDTEANPGFKVSPLPKNATPDQQGVFARDYLRGMAATHPEWNLEQLISAYNMGPGNTELGKINKDYVSKILDVAKKVPKAFGPSMSDVEENKVLAKDKAQAKVSLYKVESDANYLISVIDKAINHPGMPGVIGFPNLKEYIPGTDEAGFLQLQKQLQGKAFSQAYEGLRNAGAISEGEAKPATEALARLGKAQSQEEYIDSLNEFKTEVARLVDIAKHRAGAKNKDSGRFEIIE